jgi:hypothetical protein
MKKTTRRLIEARLKKVSLLLEEALSLAEDHGWPNAIGFCAGEGPHMTICIIESYDVRDSRNAKPQAENCISAVALGWDCGAW